MITISYLSAQQLAFPGAEGFGRYVSGGRLGKVIEVTSLKDSGPGSLREAAESAGSRVIIFKTGGTIFLNEPLEIKNGDLTIAGQTAPGGGICIAGFPVVIRADNIIIRFVRFRLGDINNVAEDAIMAINQKDIIIDHCSMSWGIDEVATFYDNENTTVQWCIISESLHHSIHPKGEHGYAAIWGGKGASFHHNLLAHHASRMPRFNGSRTHREPERELVDFRNNVIYNWGFNNSYGGESGRHNIIANYYKAGPASRHKNRIVEPWDKDGQWYVYQNYVDGFDQITHDNWNGGVQGEFKHYGRVDHPHQTMPVNTHPSPDVLKIVLADAGANLPVRDSIDRRIIIETEMGRAAHGGIYGKNSGIIDSQDQTGGWPVLRPGEPLADADQDGMPDYWEENMDLNIHDPEDRNGDLNNDGYTNLENYLNDLNNFLGDTNE